MTYELPRTDDGEVDFEAIGTELWDAFNCHQDVYEEILKAIDANARAEERRSCARECYLLSLGWEGSSRVAAKACEEYIRARGDSQ